MQKPGYWGTDQIEGNMSAVVRDEDDVICDPGINETVWE
jgi:hypothetical protein